MYVDDIIFARNSMDEIDRVKITLDVEFKIKDLGKMKYFICIEAAWEILELTFTKGSTA